MVVFSNCTDVSGLDFENVFEQRRRHFFTSATLHSFTGGLELALPCWILPPMLYHSPGNYEIRNVVAKVTENERLFMMHDHLGNSWQLEEHLLKQHQEALSSIHAPMVRALKMMKKLNYTEALDLFRLACERMWPCHRKMSLGLWVLLHLGHASLRAAMVATDAPKGHLLLQQALEALEECAENAKATTLHYFNRSVLFSATVGMAWVYFFKGDPSRAMGLVRESQRIVVDRRALSARADCNLDLVWALIAFHTVWGDLKEVQAYLNKLGCFYSQTEDEYHMGAMEIHIEAVLKGNLNTGFYIACKYLAQGRLLFHPQRDAERSEILPDHLHALICGMLGDIWFALGINSEAMLAYEKAYVEDNLLLRAGSLVGKANVCMRMLGEGDASNIDKATQNYKEAFSIYEGLGHKTGMAIVHCNLGSLHQEQEQFEQALKHFTMAREAFVVDVLGLDCRVAQLELLRGNANAAVDLFQRSLHSLDQDKPMLVAWVKHQVGLCFLQDYHIGKGKGSDALMKAKNNLLDAVTIFAKVQFTMTTTPPLMFVVFEGQKATYRLLEWCFAAEGKAMEAFVWAERGRSRLLMQERWDDVIEHYRLDDRKHLEALGSRAFDSLSYDSAWTCLRKWQHFCSLPKAAIVEYTICSDFGIIIYVLDRDSKPKVSCRAFRDLGDPELASGKKFETFINHSVDMIVRGSESQANECLARLYDLLLRPVEVHLKRLNQLVIVPHEVLFKVPFAALIYKSGCFLIQKYRLSLADSVRSLIRSSMLTRQHRASRLEAEGNANMLIAGIGDHSAVGEANLAFAEREAKQVARILKKVCGDEKLVVLLGDKATKNAVLGNIKMSSVVHLATHAMVTNKHEQGAILLSAAGKMQTDESIMSWPSNPSVENRAVEATAVLRSTERFQQKIEITREIVMDAEELSRIVLSADLMVLSACQTGRGVIAGEGVAGLGRAVCTAGVACSVLSLWPVGDEATYRLMETFYQELVAHNKDVGSAMQTSMVKMIEEKAKFGGSRWTVDCWAAFLPFGLPTVTISKL